MKIKITNAVAVTTGTRTEIKRVVYIALSADDCRDFIDKSAYNLAVKHGTIQLGQVTAQVMK